MTYMTKNFTRSSFNRTEPFHKFPNKKKFDTPCQHHTMAAPATHFGVVTHSSPVWSLPSLIRVSPLLHSCHTMSPLGRFPFGLHRFTKKKKKSSCSFHMFPLVLCSAFERGVMQHNIWEQAKPAFYAEIHHERTLCFFFHAQ